MEQKEKQKPKFFKRIFSGLKPVFRGVVKSLPLGNVAIEIFDNVKKEVKENTTPKQHSYISIFIQLVCIALIIYAFSTKQITIEQVLQLLNFDPGNETNIN